MQQLYQTGRRTKDGRFFTAKAQRTQRFAKVFWVCVSRFAPSVVGLRRLNLQRQHLRSAVTSHGDSVQGIGSLDGSAIVGDDYELCLRPKLLQRRAEPGHIALVKRRVD